MRVLFLVLIFVCPILGFSQTSYFQQEVRYKINVQLNDEAHTLSGQVDLTYTNRSTTTLDKIYFHLWANAFQNQKTAFAKQLLNLQDNSFYFAAPDELGGYENIEFKAEGQAISWNLDPENADIAILRLSKPLAPNQQLKLNIPFTLQIPFAFSRLGHLGQNYYVTQWYPKPAVFDHEGWHPIPYLHQGEFYSEFGTYEVEITVPKAYKVGATGNRVKSTSSDLKTIRFQAQNVHDFAWFASKDFQVQQDTFKLPGGKSIKINVLAEPDYEGWWKEAIRYSRESLSFFSKQIGEYPYDQFTTVLGGNGFNQGMEYPMITLIAPTSDQSVFKEILAHEIAHNWFHGILGSNERKHPWLDEGPTSYYEQRFMKLETEDLNNRSPFLNSRNTMPDNERYYLQFKRRGFDQASTLSIDNLSGGDYYLGAYLKPTMGLEVLAQHIGIPRMDSAFQTYFQQWKFKHPSPRAFQEILETETQLNLDWYFEQWLGTTKNWDYTIEDIDSRTGYTIQLENKGQISGPTSVGALKDGKIIALERLPGFLGDTSITFSSNLKEVDAFIIDPNRVSPEFSRSDNYLKVNKGLFRRAPLKLQPLGNFENDRKTYLFSWLGLGWNEYDKFMLGLAFHNRFEHVKPFEWSILPMYAFGSRDIVGIGNARYNWLPTNSSIRRVTLDLGFKRFHFDSFEEFDTDLSYWRFTPSLRIDFSSSSNQTYRSYLKWRTLFINTEGLTFSNTGDFTGIQNNDRIIHELSYVGENRTAINPFAYRIRLEQQAYDDFTGDQNYIKAEIEFKWRYIYRSGKGINIRFFGGAFLQNTQRDAGRIALGAFNMIGQGNIGNDYLLDGYFFGRSEQEGVWTQQVQIRDGGFKTPIEPAFNLGRSNSALVALNIKADLPIRFPGDLPIKPFFDLGYYDNALPTGNNTLEDQLLWSGGFMLDFLDGRLGLYIPLINSENLADRLSESGNFFSRISFSLDLNRLNPFDLLQENNW